MLYSETKFPQEVIEEIFTHLTAKRYTLISFFPEIETPLKRELLSCALACKAFSLPALRALWHTMDSMIPLLKLLPNFKLTVDDRYVLVGSINNSTSQRFDFYSRMVKSFFHGFRDRTGNSYKLADSVYHLLSIMRPMPLPSLTRFCCVVDDPEETFHWMPLFLSASLKAAYIHVHPYFEADLLIYLYLVKEVASSFERLVVDCQEKESTFCYLEAASQLESLRALQLTLPRTGHNSTSLGRDIPCLGALQHLEEIHLESRRLEHSYGHGQEVRGHFPSLKRLYLGTDYFFITAFLDVFRNSPLELLDVCALGLDRDQDACEDIFQAVVHHWSETLTSFSFDLGAHYPWAMERSELKLSHSIETLYSLRRLKVFQLTGCSRRLYMTNKDVSTLCDAWPHLTDLKIGVRPGGQDFSPTPSSLPILFRRCRNLKRATLPLYVSNPPPLITLDWILPSHELGKVDYIVDEDELPEPRPRGCGISFGRCVFIFEKSGSRSCTIRLRCKEM
ncbi:hypothetical protein VKT23_019672 [Stygiomarasmius scandens]|uniref:F-box domain-containing protein n=1 Tax=Marasmiellus scandens TaxID=2682957 RepID=A0ABR1IMC5_9AGAR